MRLEASDREAIGTLLSVGFRGARGARFEEDVEAMRAARVGGVVLFDRDLATGAGRNIEGPAQVERLVGELRARLGDGLVVTIDQEGGRVARLRAERGFEDDVGASAFAKLDDAGRREAADRQALQLARLGVTMNFAPCVDVAVALDGPVIGALGRSYGDDADVVVECARNVIEAHRSRGVACCVKHFPGHGSARVDSHDEVAEVSATYDEEREFGAFERLIESARPEGVMVGHLLCDRFDAAWPASLSRATIEGVLRGRLGFGGVVVTDSLDMGSIGGRYGLDEAVVLAVNAGADMIVNGFNRALQDADAMHPAMELHEAIERGVVDGTIEGGMARIEESARRVRGLRGGGLSRR